MRRENWGEWRNGENGETRCSFALLVGWIEVSLDATSWSCQWLIPVSHSINHNAGFNSFSTFLVLGVASYWSYTQHKRFIVTRFHQGCELQVDASCYRTKFQLLVLVQGLLRPLSMQKTSVLRVQNASAPLTQTISLGTQSRGFYLQWHRSLSRVHALFVSGSVWSVFFANNVLLWCCREKRLRVI